jgi:putative ABC transport system permease protein
MQLAWLQLVAEKRRLAAALAGIAFAVMLQLMQFGFRDAMFDSATTLHDRLVADLILTSTLYENVVAPGTVTERRLYQALGVAGVESVRPVHLGAAPFKNPQTGRDKVILVIGLNPDHATLDIPSVIERAHLAKIPDVALYDALSRPEFGPIVERLGEAGAVTTEVAGRRTTIRGLFELGVSFAGNGHLIVGDTTFRRLFNRSDGVFEFGLIRLQPGTDVAAAQAALVERLPGDVKVLTHAELRALERDFWNTNTPVGFIFLIASFIGLLVGSVIVYQILYTDVSDHLAEYATLKAMGYSDRYLNLVVIEQALILSIAGFPIGFLLAQLLYVVARDATHLPIVMTVPRAAIVFAMTVFMCCLSASVAIRKLRSADPAEVF